MSAWTEERIDGLKKLWGDGLSASQIAGSLGGITRNAVIGKAFRLGLASRTRNHNRRKSVCSQPAKARATLPKPKSSFAAFLAKQPREQASPVQEPFIPPEQRKRSIVDLDAGECKWPIGEGPYEFCARKQVKGLPYCKDHARCAYVLPTPHQKNSGSQYFMRGFAKVAAVDPEFEKMETA